MSTTIEVPQIDIENLPKDLGVCQAMIVELLQAMARKDTFIGNLQHQLNQLLRHRFGQRADRVSEAQLMLFMEELAKAQGEEKKPEEPTPEPKKPQGNGKGHGRKPLPAELPREIIVHDVPEVEKICGKCETPKIVIRQQTTEQLEYVPATLKVFQHVQPVYACPKGCEGQMAMASKPMQPIEKGLPGPGLLAHVVTSKYADHLPLTRQEGIFKRHGIEISKQTQWEWVWGCAKLMEPLYELMRTEVLASKVIHTDDTPVDVQDRNHEMNIRQGRVWVYSGDEDHPYIVYDYTQSRKRDGPVKFLTGFNGTLQADAYGGYDGIYAGKDVTEAGCWAHARRKYVEAEATRPEIAVQAVARIKLLYDVEDEAKEYLEMHLADLDPKTQHQCFLEKRYELRQEKSKDLIDQFAAWLRQQTTLPKSPIGEAIGYTLRNLDALKTYLEDGAVDIDNNVAERALRGLAIGRNNWTFFGSDRGGKAAATLYSLVQTCKRHAIDPFEYLRDVFTRISGLPVSRLSELLPDQWKALRDEAKLTLAAIPAN